MKKFLLSFLCFLLAIGGGYAEEATATLTFDNSSKRTTFTTSQQVWEESGITLTNDQASSSSEVADYAKPARFYKNSAITVEAPGKITKIVFDCNSSSYATALKNSISGSSVSASSDKVTVTLDGSSNEFIVEKLSGGQVRMDALTVTYIVPSSGVVSKPATPTLTAGCNFVGSMNVEISCTTEGVEIYYTTDGTEPTEDSEAYIECFEITETTTVKAIAVNEVGASNVATAEYTRVAATPEIQFDGETFEESVEVTITAAEGTTAYYTLNGKTPTKDSDECPETLTLRADATLQVIAYDEDGYDSPVVKQAFKQNASNAGSSSTGTATLVTDAKDLVVGDQVVIVASGSNVALSTTQNTNNRGCIGVDKSDDKSSVTLNEQVQILTLENGAGEGQYAFQTGVGYLYAASTSANHLKTGSTLNNKASFTIAIENGIATIKADQGSRNWLRFNSTNDPKIFSCYTSGQADVSLYKVNLSSVEDYVLNVTAAGWSTLYLGYNVVIPAGVTCYVIDEVIEGTVKLTAVESNILPANTAVIVKAEPGEYTFTPTESTADVTSNMEGTIKNEYITKDAYVLAIVDDEVGLYKAAMNGGVFLNNANKAYLSASAVTSNVKALKFDLNTTAVENVKVETEGKKVIYDLSGRRVNDMTAPGLYIVNGKKVMVK